MIWLNKLLFQQIWIHTTTWLRHTHTPPPTPLSVPITIKIHRFIYVQGKCWRKQQLFSHYMDDGLIHPREPGSLSVYQPLTRTRKMGITAQTASTQTTAAFYSRTHRLHRYKTQTHVATCLDSPDSLLWQVLERVWPRSSAQNQPSFVFSPC